MCVVGEEEKREEGRGGGERRRGVEGEPSRCETKYVIKRSRGHIRGGPDRGNVTPLLCKLKLMFLCFLHVFMFACVCL